MDCKQFRKEHLSYLDNTLSGEATTAAQQHLLACDVCAAHDALVRRSLMVVRSLPALEPSDDFRIQLRERLAACRSDDGTYPIGDELGLPRQRSPRPFMVVTACLVLVVVTFQGMGEGTSASPSMHAAPVAQQSLVSVPPPLSPSGLVSAHMALPVPGSVVVPSYVTPALIQAMATGNPLWSATMLVEDAPMQMVGTHFSFEMR